MKILNAIVNFFKNLTSKKQEEVKKEEKPTPTNQVMITQMSMAYRVAQTQIGVKEKSGTTDDPKIVEYHQSCTLQATDDETPWCSSFVNWCYIIAGMILNPGGMISLLKKLKYEESDITLFLKSAIEVNKITGDQNETVLLQRAATGVPVKIGTRSAMARSWLNFGKKVESPKQGDIVVFERGNNGVSGHVGFIESDGLTYINTLGGNQSNTVKFSSEARFRVLAYISED